MRRSWLFFSLGSVSQVCQVVLLRELLTLAEGTELTIAFVLGSWLTFVAFGSFAAAKLLTRKGQRLDPAFSYSVASAFLAASVFFDLWLIRFSRTIFSLPPGEPLSIAQWLEVTIATLLPICFIVGAQFAFAASFTNPSGVYIAESVGAVIAGALLSLLLLRWFDHSSLSSFFLALHLLSSLVLLWFHRPNARWVGAAISAVAGLSLVFAPLVEQKTQAVFWRSMFPAAEKVHSVASPYGSIAAIKFSDLLSVYQNGHLLFTLPDQGDVASLVHLILLQHPKPRRVLLIGGLGGWVQATLQHSKVVGVDWVELDPTIPQVVFSLLPSRERNLLSDPRLRRYTADGRSFISQARQTYDVVIVVAPDPTTAASNRFFTKEFFSEVLRVLRPSGVFALHGLREPPAGFGELYFARNHCVYATMLKVFCEVIVVPSSPLTLLGRCPANSSPPNELARLTLDEQTLLQRAKERGLEGINLFAFTDPIQVERVNYELKTGLPFNPLEREQARVLRPKWLNSDINPTVYFLSSLLWLRVGSEKVARLLEFFVFLPRWSIWLLALLPFGFWLVGRIRSANWAAPATTIVVISGVGMLAELTVLLTFQARFGTLYLQVGLLFALFMLGLALGALVAERNEVSNSVRALALLSIATSTSTLVWLGLVFCFPQLPPAVVAILCGCFMVLFGCLVGAAFPLTVKAMRQSGIDESKAAGLTYAYDLVGGALGAFIFGAILLPLWGVPNLLFLCALLCFVTAAICWVLA
jgi:spermidine synthase